jgi:hypothetical protein
MPHDWKDVGIGHRQNGRQPSAGRRLINLNSIGRRHDEGRCQSSVAIKVEGPDE